MKKSLKQFCRVAVLSLVVSAFWQNFAAAAVAPVIKSLGRLQGDLKAPTRLAVDGRGNLYVADPRSGRIVRFDPYGQLSAVLADIKPSTGAFAVVPDGSVLYVATAEGIAEVDGSTGALRKKLPLSSSDAGAPIWIDLDSAGFIYLADGKSRLVKVLDPQGRLQYQFGLSGATPFASIFALRVDAARGEVWVADSLLAGTSQPAVHVYSPAGTRLRTLAAATAFGTPAATFFGGVTFDDAGRAYVLDQHRSEIRIVEVPSRFLSSYVKVGYLPGQLTNPVDVAYDATTKRLFVLCADGRIEIFGIDGGTTPIRVNVAPGLPRPLAPVASSEVAAARPELVFTNAVDPDGDRLTYQVRVLQGEKMVAEQSGIAEGPGSTAVTVASALAENTRFEWRVQASDGRAVSGWSDPQSFWVNAVEEPPAPPVLISPLAGEVIDGSGVLSWAASSDPDPFDTVSYVLEISPDPSFATMVVNEVLDGTSLRLSDGTGYPLLDDGARYWWRVRGVDNHGLASAAGSAGSFTYDTTELRVSASLPGASVYLGGNLAYPGRLLGTGPVVVRDLPPGAYSVVVERSGAETFVGQVVLAERENVQVRALLRPALSPDLLPPRPLSAFDGVDLIAGASPFAVDFDNDGHIDLLLGREQGGILLYRGLPPDGSDWPLTQGVDLRIALPGAVPFAADWDNDGRKDLIVGSSDGTVHLFLNGGSEAAPAFANAAILSAAGGPLQVKGPAVPVVIDHDGDGDKDLVVGTGEGEVLLFANAGTDEAPQLEAGEVLATLAAPAAPFFADWDADGRRDLLVASGGSVRLYPALADGKLGSPSILAASPGGKGRGLARLFAADLPVGKGKDLVVGSAGGQLLLAPSQAKTLSPAALAAAKAKAGEIRTFAEEEAPKLLPTISVLAQELDRGDLKSAVRIAGEIVRLAPAGGTTAAAAAELGAFLQ